MMWCPHCESADTKERRERTTLGYPRFRCQTCRREFNERTGTRFNHLQYPTDVVCLVVLWRVRYKLSLRDLAEMFLERGVVFTHEAVRDWEEQLAPLLSETLRKHRRGRIGSSWYVDETFIKVKGRLVYLYRAIDRYGNLVDVLLSEKRDKAAAQAFFRSAPTVTGCVPERVTSDGHDAYPGAIKSVLGEAVCHRTNRYLNNHLEQDHRGIKQRIRPMGGFKSVESANRFCRAHDEVRNFLRPLLPQGGRIACATATALHCQDPGPSHFLSRGIKIEHSVSYFNIYFLVGSVLTQSVKSERGKTEGSLGRLKSRKYGFSHRQERSLATQTAAGQRAIVSVNLNTLMRDLAEQAKAASLA